LAVYAVYSSTGEEAILKSGEFKKSDFPLPVLIPVVQDFKTTVKVYMNNNLQYQLEVFARQ
jgi:hypothetical protein